MTAQPDNVRLSNTPAPPLSAQALVALIETGREYAEQSYHDEAVEKLSPAVNSPLLSTEQRAKVKCVLVESLEYLARYREALEVMNEYDSPAGREGLAPATLTQIWLRFGSLHGYLGDHPRAISNLKSALALAEQRNSQEDIGAAHVILGRIYRAIGETQIARDHLRTALKLNRQVGHWMTLAQSYFLLGNVCVSEGDMEVARENFEQAVKIIGERRAPLLLGSIYTSLSNLILLQEYGQAIEGVQSLEKAIFYIKQAKNERLLAYAYSNLGFVLTNIGEWTRAHEVLVAAIEIGQRIDNRIAQGTALDTLGELFILQGKLDEAEKTLHESIHNLQEANFPYGEVQAAQTLGRCYLAQGKYQQAIAAFENQLALANRLEDKRSRAAAQLNMALAQVEMSNLAAAQSLLDSIAEDIDWSANASLVGHFRMANGALHLRQSQYEEARHEFGQAITIFFMVADRYRESHARYQLALVFAGQKDFTRARLELNKARETCQQLGAHTLLLRIQQTQQEIEQNERAQALVPSVQVAGTGTLSNAMVLRLTRAAATRELLLNELTDVLNETLGAALSLVFEERGGEVSLIASNGDVWGRANAIKEQQGQKIRAASSDLGVVLNSSTRGELIYRLRSEHENLIVFIADYRRDKLRRDWIEPLFRLVEMGLSLAHSREKEETDKGYEDNNALPETTPDGYVFASPAMRSLVNDIHKIRGSRVTALITGESGTGKEVVARLVHSLSDRRNNPFIAFNCTIASPEIVNSQLFGHRKGAFTGAVADTIGVIRSADHGTLFLDEVGDLALDVQPKLLRFLQEGEIHRLGETTPTQVDVRVIAATNADLEKLVAEGKFREDLYYRLNIIRLRIPPLRERREEIPLLIDHYLKVYSEQSNKEEIRLDRHTLDLLMVYDWPGNVRQLANEIQRLVAYKDSGEVITERDLSPLIYKGGSGEENEVRNLGTVTDALLQPMPALHGDEYPVQLRYRPGKQTLGDLVAEVERQIILESMRRHSGKRNAVCDELGITRKGLYLKLRRLPGIDLSEF